MHEQRSEIERAQRQELPTAGPALRLRKVYQGTVVSEVLAQSRYDHESGNRPGVWGCRLWTGPTDGRGEGHLRWHDADYNAARVMWRAAYGELDEGEEIVHTCNRMNCIEPSHMLLRVGEAFIGAPGGNA